MFSKFILLLHLLFTISSFADVSTEFQPLDVPKVENSAKKDTQQTGEQPDKPATEAQTPINSNKPPGGDIVLIYSEEKKYFVNSKGEKANMLELISEKKDSVTVLLESENYEKIGIRFKFKEVRGNRDELKVVMSSYDEDFSKKYASIVFVLNVKDTLDKVNASFLDSFDELLENDPRGEFFHFSDGQMIGLMVFAAIGAVVVLRFALIPTAVITGVTGISYLIYKTVKKIYFNESEKGEENISIDDVVGKLETKA